MSHAARLLPLACLLVCAAGRVLKDVKPDDVALVDKATFMASVDVLQRESAKAAKLDPPSLLSEAERSGETAYAIGKTTAKLPLSEAEGLSLVEATYLVLVSGVTPPLARSGLQVKDTIMSMSVAGTQFHESTKAMDLAATAERLTAAIKTAQESGVAEVDLELNRLVQLQFADT